MTGGGIGAVRGVAEEFITDQPVSPGGALGGAMLGMHSGLFGGSLTSMIGLALGGSALAYAGTGALLGATGALLSHNY